MLPTEIKCEFPCRSCFDFKQRGHIWDRNGIRDFSGITNFGRNFGIPIGICAVPGRILRNIYAGGIDSSNSTQVSRKVDDDPRDRSVGFRYGGRESARCGRGAPKGKKGTVRVAQLRERVRRGTGAASSRKLFFDRRGSLRRGARRPSR